MSERHATFHGWRIEARINTDTPRQIGDEIFDSRWRFVKFERAPFGVPNSSLYASALDECGLLSYEQAQALRWWFHAQAPFLCGLETRLVSFKVKHDIEWSRVGEQDLIDERPGLSQPSTQQRQGDGNAD